MKNAGRKKATKITKNSKKDKARQPLPYVISVFFVAVF
jgi:hypothetical protein